jgi:hypothetical protein
MRMDLRQVLADTAYGGAADRHKILAEHGVRLVAPPPPIADAEPNGALPRSAFSLDFDAMSATSPNQITTTDLVRVEDHAEPHLRFRWPLSARAECPLRLRCLKKRQTTPKVAPVDGRTGRPTKVGRVLDLHPFEQELREARAAWLDPSFRQIYRDRTQAERLISQIVRHGGRVARAWGRQAASLQAHAIAMRCNLELVARQIAAFLNPKVRVAA